MQFTRSELAFTSSAHLLKIYSELLDNCHVLWSISLSSDRDPTAFACTGDFLLELIKHRGPSASSSSTISLCQPSQLFFGNRIRVLSGNRYIVILCFVLNVTSLAGCLVLMANIWSSSDALTVLRSRLEWELIAFSAVGPVVDVIIATSMCFHLWRLRQSEPRSGRCVSQSRIQTFRSS